VRPYIAHAKVAVAPLRMARGVQNKVLEAMAMAKPVLASPQAVEGIEARVGTEVLVAANETEYVQKATRLLRLDGASAIGVAGRARVLASYDWQSSLSRFERLLANGEGVATEHRPAPDAAVEATASSRMV
jgi:glycosyltransferase involved in cell wall biosynthesis